MIADLLQAFWIALFGGALVFWAARGAAPSRWMAPFALTAALVLASPLGPGLTSYGSDVWMYVTLAERAALGDWLLDREALWLQPPADPHQGVEWILIGRLHHLTGVPSLVLIQCVGALVFVALSLAVWRLARDAFADPRARWIALLCFWMTSPGMWASLPLGRILALVFVVEAARAALVFRGSARDVLRLGLAVAAAFYAQSFGGLMAAGAAGLVAAVRLMSDPLPVVPVIASGVLALLVASPVVAAAAAQAGLPMAGAYLRGPGDVQWLGVLWLNPGELVHQTSAVMIVLAIAGVWASARATLHPALRRFCVLANIGLALLFFTPLYQVAVKFVGGWMVPRLAFLGFWWLPATGTLTAMVDAKPRPMTWAAAGAVTLLFWQGGARVIRDYQHPEVYRPVTAEARADAEDLRDAFKDQLFLSSPHLAYMIASYSLGKPLAVPPGHASPFHPFEQRQRDGVAALSRNTADCWVALFSRYPDLKFLVTPLAEESVEGDLWRSEIPARPSSEVRAELLRLHVLAPVRMTRRFFIDAITPSTAAGNAAACGAQP
ncbi:MAG: hypothetical protein HY048_05920 [Acidobacteria bacterium]|nr:hypothetical protein [Acidobacteriota bacterium]